MAKEAKTSEEVDYKSLFEKEQGRRRGLQSENSKLKHQISLKEAEADKVRELSTPKISKEDTDRLNDLKYSDPDAWRKEMDSLEGKQKIEIDEHLKVVAQKNSESARERQLDDAYTSLATKHSDFKDVVNNKSLADEVPPRITNKFKSGELDAEDYLEQAYKFITAQKSVKNPTKTEEPDLNSVPGGNTPDTKAVNEDLNSSYSKTIF